MKRLGFGLLVLIIILGMLASCAAPVDNLGNLARKAKEEIRLVDADKVVMADGGPAAEIIPYKSTRTNASGDKIPSNAHSADFPGVYFYWADKQKDNSYLLVEPYVFGKYDGFVLTKKVSQTYWDYPIALQPGQAGKTVSYLDKDWYVFFIPDGKVRGDWVWDAKLEIFTAPVIEDHQDKSNGQQFNINMVFIPEFKVKNPPPAVIRGPSDVAVEGVLEFQKVVTNGKAVDFDKLVFDIYFGDKLIVEGVTLDADGKARVVSKDIVNGESYKVVERFIGTNKYEAPKVHTFTSSGEVRTVSIVSKGESDATGRTTAQKVGLGFDPNGAWSGDVVSYWSNQIRGQYPAIYGALEAIRDSKGNSAEWVWSRWDSWMTGYDGSEVILYTKSFDLGDCPIPAAANVYFACDNAAVVYVNGKFAGYTFNAIVDNPAGKGNYWMTGNSGDYKFATLDYQTIRHQEEFWKHAYEANIAGLLQPGFNQITFYAANSSHMQENGESIYNPSNNPAGIIFASQFKTEKAGAEVVNVFENTLKPQYGPSYGSVTGTNIGNDPANFVYPGENHFVYAVATKAELAVGIELAMYVGNKFDRVGTAYAKLEGGNIVVTIEGIGSFGLLVSDKPFKSGTSSDIKHNNKVEIAAPAGDTVYLYIHCDKWAFPL